MNEGDLNKAATRGTRAKLLLEDELLVEAFTAIRADYIEKLLATNTQQAEAREKLYMGVRILDEVKAHLETIVTNGTVAIGDLKNLADTAERKRRFSIV